MNYVTSNILFGEVIWYTVEDSQVLDSDVKLNRENPQDLTNAYLVADSSPGYSYSFSPQSCESNNLEDIFPIEKYSKYTASVSKWYINSSSPPEHSSLDKNTVSEMEFVNRTSPSEVLLTRLRPTEKQNISNNYSSAKSEQETWCNSESGGDRKQSDRESFRDRYEENLFTRKLNIAVSEEKEGGKSTSGSSCKKESDVLKTVIKNTVRCQYDKTSDGSEVEEKVTENEGKNLEPSRGNCSSNRESKICTLETHGMKLASNKESDTIKKKSSKLTGKQKSGRNPTIKHYFKMKNTKHISSCSESEQSVKTPDSISDSDDCVPGTPVHTTQFGIEYTNRNEDTPVNSLQSLDHRVKGCRYALRNQLAKSKLADYDTVKSSNKTEMPLGNCSKPTKQGKCSKLFTKRKRQKPLVDASKKVNAGIPLYFGSPVQVVKCSVARNFEITDNSICGTVHENNSQLNHSPCHSVIVPRREDPENCGKRSTFHSVFQQHLKNTVNTTNSDDIYNEHLSISSRKELEEKIGLSNDSLICGIGQQELKIVPDASLKTNNNFETKYRQEVATSSDNSETKHEQEATSNDNEGQDFKVSHLTLQQLEQRFKNNVQHLCDIMKGKKYCWRHEQFKKGGTASNNLHYAVTTVPYTDSQLDHLLSLLRETFCHKHSYVTYSDYIMKVLLPEATTKIFMDEFSLSHQETLHKIHNIYIISDTSWYSPTIDHAQ